MAEDSALCSLYVDGNHTGTVAVSFLDDTIGTGKITGDRDLILQAAGTGEVGLAYVGEKTGASIRVLDFMTSPVNGGAETTATIRIEGIYQVHSS